MNSGIFSNAPYLYAWMIYSEVWWKEKGKGEMDRKKREEAEDRNKLKR